MQDAIFGGTFDPVHRGHVHLVREILNKTAVERIVLVPARQNPLKAHYPGASEADRTAMLKLALQEFRDRCTISLVELHRPPPAYAVETVAQLVQAGTVHQRPGFLMGDDLLPELPRWERWHEFLQQVQPVVILRNFRETDILPAYPYLPPDSVVVSAEPVVVSSRAIRARGRTLGQSGWEQPENFTELQELVPENVARYIRDHGLYH